MTALKFWDSNSGSWKTIAALQGPPGENGQGLNILGDLPNAGSLPPSADVNDTFIIGGHFWVYTDFEGWIDAGAAGGPQGADGAPGPIADLQRFSARGSTQKVGVAGGNVIYDYASITLQPGRYLIRAAITCAINTADAAACAIWNQTSGAEVANSRGAADTCPTAGYATSVDTEVEVTITTATQFCPLGCRHGGSVLTVGTGAAGSIGGQISAIRLISSTMPRVPFVSALPVSPVDGEEVYFQNAAMAALGIVWHFRYRAGAPGSYKWEFLGGSSMRADALPNVTFTNTGWAATPSSPTLTVPLSGDYDFAIGARVYTMNPAGSGTQLQLALNGAGTGIMIDAYQGSSGASIALFASHHYLPSPVAAAAGALATLWGAVPSGTANISNRWISMIPKRVG